MTIERQRPVRLPSRQDAEVEGLAFALRAAGLPEPVRELHFAWCCEHPRDDHAFKGGRKPRDPNNDLRYRCQSCSGLFAPYHPYRHERDWRFDLCWPDRMLAVEVDGGVYAGGRHTRGVGFERDAEKLNEAVLRGWRVLRVTPRHIEDGTALEWVERAFGKEA